MMNNNIGKLFFWCQKVLPLVYDNSLSYYEVLCKLQKKVNELVDNVNAIPEYIDQKVIESFNEEHLRELISEVFRTIEDAITANNEETNTNFQHDYPAVGTLVWHDNKLYRTKRAIDAGDTIIPNTNIELVNFGDMFTEFLEEVKSRFTDNDDGQRETSSTDRPTHDLVWLNNELYEAIKPIAEGNAYIFTGVNKNVESVNLDKIYDYLLDLISSEINAREEADGILQDNIDAEALTREQADTTLQNNIDAETLAREQADSGLQNNIDAEALAREQADTGLQNSLDAETLARERADADIIDRFTCVNVKHFGAVGNARYYNKTSRTYWVDSNYTVAPHNDVEAVNAAIAYAVNHGIGTIYFPAGYYYLPNWTYNIDISKLRFVGEGETALVSSGLTSGAFITISSPLMLDMYNTAKTPLENISLWGCYGIGSGVPVNGLYIDIPVNVVACHCSFRDIVVKDFYIGYDIDQGYKTIWYNISAIACQTGINLAPNAGIPMYFIGGFVECCGVGLFSNGTGWTQIVFDEFAFEYNLEQIGINSGIVFRSCRFENDPLCTRASYNITINGDDVFFDRCDFLLLHNFVENVNNWIANPSQYINGTSITAALFAGTGNFNMRDCNIGLDNTPVGEGFYIINFEKTSAINCRFKGSTAAMLKLIDSTEYQAISTQITLG